MTYYLSYFVLIPALLLSIIAQARISTVYHKYSHVQARSGLTAAQIARRLLAGSGLQSIPVQQVGGTLSDHYDPRTKVLRLSKENYDASSVAALGVAAHECGHAMQDAEGYFPLKLRSVLAPVASIGSQASWLLILVGLFFDLSQLLNLGIIFFGAAVLFQLVTLPVEFNASRRALAALDGGYMNGEELQMANKVLKAAALTYVAAALVAVLQLLRLLLVFGGRRKR